MSQARWVATARELDGRGYFQRYSPRQREEILRKGYLGPWRPDEAIKLAEQHLRLGIVTKTNRLVDRMRDDLGVEVHEVNEALAAVLGEVPAENYRPPRELQDPPGIPFVFESYYFRRTIYLKIQIVGVRKPRVLVWSCHPPDYDWK